MDETNILPKKKLRFSNTRLDLYEQCGMKYKFRYVDGYKENYTASPLLMGVAVDNRAPPGFAGLIIGLTVGGIITATGNIAGASLNPARTFGPYLADLVLGGKNFWIYFPIYVIGPVIGAVIAVLLYAYLTSEIEEST